MSTLALHSLSVSEMDNQCYFLVDGDHALLIDAADDAAKLLAFAEELGVTITAVLTTHRHWDHTRAVEEVLKKTGAKHYASHLDAPAIPGEIDVELHHGDVVEFAGEEYPVIILRGHTPGGVALAAVIDGVPNLFVGDSLFPGGLGKTDSEGDFVRLFHDVNGRIFEQYPDETKIWPGHGNPTTLGEERGKLEEWWERRW
ncbi:MBL fold metallo-hydrolase [Corynebacterium propinquum]|uniref:MBL fold metallo-hydrolase n=1 Tax=Corynebacterium propinquum TaxID=43769 RepID=UPI0026705A73|nr:MBL fold metallo-hydrolase [Corynebacterium propinquum]WKS31834.1 MBL fold metallo-hydrolase [Corynebacterium propinquum]WKS36164.1 MBL fold metallo-hydrolase [Corynebacterium propinquum]WKS38335.1 MBL fold metallo-hydrolase [Corynebacterium propinquum]WKS42495.1 MBL fold metallo-hydrolase [Corynebacterium propinquum]WKS46791.1 MBL fold metallo-hydrolase [Corynebacterium propinquum]